MPNFSDGVIVAALSEIYADGGLKCPAREAGIQPGDRAAVDVRQARKVQTHLGNDVDALRMGFESRERKGRQQQSSDFFHNSYLERRQTHAVDFSIEVEGIDVGHTRYIIDDGLNFTVQRGGMYFVLFGHFVQQ